MNETIFIKLSSPISPKCQRLQLQKISSPSTILVCNKTNFAPNYKAMVAFPFLPYLPFASTFPCRMDKFNAVSVSNSEYRRFCQKPFCPILMAFQKPKQPCPFRKFGKKMKEISLEPSVKLPFAFSSHGKEKSYSDNFAWIEF